MAGSGSDVSAPGDVLYCVNHPQTETLIRCSRCLDPICPKCAVRTAVGLRCRKCAGIGRSPLYALEPRHYVIAALVALVAALIAGALVTQLGLLFTFFLAAPAGGLVAEAVIRSTRKRGRAMQVITAVCIVLGAYLGPGLVRVFAAGTFAVLSANPRVFLGLLLNISSLIYVVMATGVAIARLR
jgi:hypothetical protein